MNVGHAPRNGITTVSRPSLGDALDLLDEALADLGHGRSWRRQVERALVRLQSAAGHHTDGADLLHEIARGEPRLARAVQRWWNGADALARDARRLRRRLRHDPPLEELRDELATLARRTRRLQRDESDLIFDALHTDVGGYE